MRRLLIVLFGSCSVVGALGFAPAAPPEALIQGSTKLTRADPNNRFAGTWKLARIERVGPKGELLPAPAAPAFGSPNPVGFLMYDASGYMGVTIMQSGRAKYAGPEPTPEEARAALTSYVSYFGTFSVDEPVKGSALDIPADGVVTHRVQGSLNPSMEAEQRRSFQMSGNQLILKTPPGSTGTQLRLIWERVPDLRQLTAEHHRFIGVWKHVGSERRTVSGQLLQSEPSAARAGVLIYTAAGYMAVHLMDPGRKKYAGAQPTPDEALIALRSYGSAYFGPYTIHQTEGYVVHHQLGMINPGGGIGTDTLRGYELVGDNRLILKPPEQTVNGQKVQNYVTWERVTPRVRSSQ